MGYLSSFIKYCSLFLFVLASCGGNNGNKGSSSNLTLQSLNPDLGVYESGALVSAQTETDCSDCNVLIDGNAVPVTDYVLSVPVALDVNLNKAATQKSLKYPAFQIPSCQDASEEGGCEMDVVIRQNGETSNKITIQVQNAQPNIVGPCATGEAQIHGNCVIVECPPDHLIKDGLCIEKESDCEDDGECGEDFECSSEGQCVKKVGPLPCDTDEQCGEGKMCADHSCTDKPVQSGLCTSNEDCVAGKTCQDGTCQDLTEKPECTADTDCSEGYACQEQTCKKKSIPLDKADPEDKKKAYDAFKKVTRTNENTYSCKEGQVLLGKVCIAERACLEKGMFVVPDQDDKDRKYCFCGKGIYEIPQEDGTVQCKGNMDDEDRKDVIDGARSGGDGGTYWRNRMGRHENDNGYKDKMGETLIDEGMAGEDRGNGSVTVIERKKPDGTIDRKGVTKDGKVVRKPDTSLPENRQKGFEALIEYARNVKAKNDCADGTALGPNKECLTHEECEALEGKFMKDEENGSVCLCQEGYTFSGPEGDLVCKSLEEIEDEDYRNRTNKLRAGGHESTWERAAAKDNKEKDDSGTYLTGLMNVATNMGVLWQSVDTGALVIIAQEGMEDVPHKEKDLEKAIEAKKKEYLDNRFCSYNKDVLLDHAEEVCLSVLSEEECKSIPEGGYAKITQIRNKFSSFMYEHCAQIDSEDDKTFAKELGILSGSFNGVVYGSQEAVLECDGNSAVTGIKLKSGLIVDKVWLQCTSLASLHNKGSYAEGYNKSAGGSGGQKTTTLQAKKGFVMTGLNARLTAPDDGNYKQHGQIVADVQAIAHRLKPWGLHQAPQWHSEWMSKNYIPAYSGQQAYSSCANNHVMTGLKVKYSGFIKSLTPICRPLTSKMTFPSDKLVSTATGVQKSKIPVVSGSGYGGGECTMSCQEDGISRLMGYYQSEGSVGGSWVVKSIKHLYCGGEEAPKQRCGHSQDYGKFVDISAPSGLVVGIKGKGGNALDGFQLVSVPYDATAKGTPEDPFLITSLVSYSNWLGGSGGGWIKAKDSAGNTLPDGLALCPDQHRLTGIKFKAGDWIDAIEGIECKPFGKKK